MLLLLPFLVPPLLESLSSSLQEKSFRIPLEKVRKPGFGDVYIANGTAGTPGQNLTVLFNPSTQYSWMPTDDCIWDEIICSIHSKYSAMRSSSFKDLARRFSAPYFLPDWNRVGKATGDLAQEIICVGPACASQFAIILSPWEDLKLFEDCLQDATIGLGYRANNTDPATFMGRLQNDHKIDALIATFQMERNPKNSSLGKGELILGQVDTSIFASSIMYVPLVKERQWKILVDKVTIGGKTLPFSENYEAYFNTNYAYIGGPYVTIVQIYHHIDARPYDWGRYNVSCDRVSSLPTVTLNIGGHELPFTPEDYIIKKPFVSFSSEEIRYDEIVCEVAFYGLQNIRKYNRNWILGTTFIEKFSTIFDMENHRVGFALPKKRFY